MEVDDNFAHRLMWVIWPAFLVAGAAEGIFFTIFDPFELHFFGAPLDMSRGARFPIEGGLIQRRGGTARHDAVAWGYARGADRLGVDIIQKCEVTGFVRQGDAVVGVQTTRGRIGAGRTAGESLYQVSGIGEAGPAEPWQPPKTLTHTTNQRSVSMARPSICVNIGLWVASSSRSTCVRDDAPNAE